MLKGVAGGVPVYQRPPSPFVKSMPFPFPVKSQGN